MNIVNKNIQCNNCGQSLQIRIINSVNVTLEPELRKMILKESLFSYYCDHCKGKVKILYPFLYHDMENSFMIYFLPGNITKKADFKFLQFPPEIKKIPKRIVNDLPTLKEEILILEKNLSDRIIYDIKAALIQIFKDRYKFKSIKGYFYGLDQINQNLRFIFFIDKNVVYKKVGLNVYDKLRLLNINNN